MAVTLNAKYLEPFVKQSELEAIFPQVQAAHHTIHERSGPGNDFLGWLDLPVDYDREEFARIQKAAQDTQPFPNPDCHRYRRQLFGSKSRNRAVALSAV